MSLTHHLLLKINSFHRSFLWSPSANDRKGSSVPERSAMSPGLLITGPYWLLSWAMALSQMLVDDFGRDGSKSLASVYSQTFM